MPIRILFDSTHNALTPTIALANKAGQRLGTLPVNNLKVFDAMNKNSWLSFNVDKSDFKKNELLWRDITDFKLLWVKEYNKLFEAHVRVDEGSAIRKEIEAVSLGEAELSQINVYSLEINTETDISRETYKPSVLYNSSDHSASILDRIIAKAPHYRIGHVDQSVSGIQRSFSFTGKSIYDCLMEVAEEIVCLIDFNCYIDDGGNIVREINVYDLEAHCLDCGSRGAFEICDNCGSSNIVPGYGDDTTIFVSSENLSDNIEYKTDVDSVKNCFRLEAGDDLMTSTIINNSPDGSGYLWYFSDAMKADMSEDLVLKLNEYDAKYNHYQTEYTSTLPQSAITQYNALVEKYRAFTDSFSKIQAPIIGYPAIIKTYYDTIDFHTYLSSTMAPSSMIIDTTAAKEALTLASKLPKTVSIKDINQASAFSSDNAVSNMARAIVDNRYKIKIEESSYNNLRWTGKISITSYSDEEDAAITGNLSCTINDDYENYVLQMLQKTLAKTITEGSASDILSLFEMSDNDFKNTLTKYSLGRLKAFYSACQGCLNILIEQGASNEKSWENKDINPYGSIYVPYHNKLGYIEQEVKVRESEIEKISGRRNEYGDLIAHGVQDYINEEIAAIREDLDIQNYLGEALWLELSSFRRDDEYKNENYISDGLTNEELIQRAEQFMEAAKNDIYKSSTLQHSISASLMNLLVLKEFEPIVDYFKIGNFIRIQIDDSIYRLRIISYQIDYDNLKNISVDFSDLVTIKNGYSDTESILNQAQSMSTSYSFVARQAKNGSDSKSIIDNWVENGLAMTKLKILDDAKNQNMVWDENGILCREYLPEFDTYDQKQLKIINRGLYFTDDNWRTSRAGIGDFAFYNPATGVYEESYGIIADTLVGNLILSKEVGIYNEAGSITMDNGGLVITSDLTAAETTIPALTIQRKVLDAENKEQLEQIMYINSDGQLVMNGSVIIDNGGDNQSLRTEFSILNDSISSVVSDSDFNFDEVRERLSKMEQTSAGVEITVGSTSERVDGFIESFEEHFEFTENGLIISRDNADTEMQIDNDSIDIVVGGETVTSMSNYGLTADVINITKMTIGKYSLVYNSNNEHLTLM